MLNVVEQRIKKREFKPGKMGREDINLSGGWRDEGGVESLVNSPKDTLDFFFFFF